MLKNRLGLNLLAVLVQITLNSRVGKSYIVNFKKICVIHGLKIMKNREKEKWGKGGGLMGCFSGEIVTCNL